MIIFPARTISAENYWMRTVNVCLGTDSLFDHPQKWKTKAELDLFAEMRALAANDESILPEEILKNGDRERAHALGLAGKPASFLKMPLPI